LGRRVVRGAREEEEEEEELQMDVCDMSRRGRALVHYRWRCGVMPCDLLPA